MTFLPENIPQELKKMPNWALWKREKVDDQIRKIPYQSNGRKAKSNDSSTWCKFDIALMAYQDIENFNGICFMMPLKPSDLIFIDVDHCIKNDIVESWALEVIKHFNSYTEKSQSGEGIHILLRGKKPIRRCRKAGSPFEIYDSLRPCYLTGDLVAV